MLTCSKIVATTEDSYVDKNILNSQMPPPGGVRQALPPLVMPDAERARHFAENIGLAEPSGADVAPVVGVAWGYSAHLRIVQS